MSYNYEQTTTNIEAIESCCEKLQNEELKKIAEVVKENLTNTVIGIALPHFLITENVKSIKHLEYTIKAATEFKGPLQPTTDEEKRQRSEYIKKRFAEDEKMHSEEGRKQLIKLRENNPYIENAIRIQALNSLVNIWTIFESSTKDIWIHLLNCHQDKFLANILEAKGNEEAEGVSGKYISIGYLGKYGFNINNKLGNILAPKFDFTSCSGIKKAFLDLDKKKKNEMEFLNDSDLFNLEVTRNLIVHNAGIIDEIYLNRTRLSNQTIGQKIDINVENYSKYENGMINTLVSLLNFCDNLV